MDLATLITLKSTICDYLEDDVEITETDGNIVIGDEIIIEITSNDFCMNHEENISILNEDDEIIGYICTQSFSKEPVNIPEKSYQTIKCFFVDTEVIEDTLIENYIFKSKYIVINAEKYQEYITKYKDSAPLWGGFSHTATRSTYIRSLESVKAIDGISLPTSINYVSLNRSILAINCFEKYLSLYHQFEIIFDLIFVRKIKSMNDSDLQDISKIVKRHTQGSTELDLLKNVLEEFCTEVTEIENILNNISVINHKDVMFNIFQDHTKNGNPFNDSNDNFEKFYDLISGQSITKANVLSSKIAGKVKTDDDYRIWLLKIIAYWLYRIRCSIAHNRIGEFVFNESHESFIDEVGVQTLRGILISSFKNQKFKELML